MTFENGLGMRLAWIQVELNAKRWKKKTNGVPKGKSHEKSGQNELFSLPEVPRVREETEESLPAKAS